MRQASERQFLVVGDQADIADPSAMHVRDMAHRVDAVHDGDTGSGRRQVVVCFFCSKQIFGALAFRRTSHGALGSCFFESFESCSFVAFLVM